MSSGTRLSCFSHHHHGKIARSVSYHLLTVRIKGKLGVLCAVDLAPSTQSGDTVELQVAFCTLPCCSTVYAVDLTVQEGPVAPPELALRPLEDM